MIDLFTSGLPVIAQVSPEAISAQLAQAGTAPPADAPLGGWLHTLSPFAWRISGDFGLRWYGLSYIIGMVAGYLVLAGLISRRLFVIPRERLFDVFLYMVIGVLVGGRLGYVLFYQPSLLVEFHAGFPWWGVLEINRGGMASHGGLLGVIAAAIWASRGFRSDDGARIPGPTPMTTLDAAALVTPIGLGLGRIANFINGELLGKIVSQPGEPAPAWSVRFPQEIVSGHADMVYSPEASAALDRLLAENAREPLEPVGVTLDRIVSRIRNGDADLAARLEGLLSARVPSQILQALAEGLALFLVVWIVAAAARKPGVISGVFLIAYGVMRVITEVWRLPDAHLIQAGTDQILGLSRGQLLSVGMVVLGVGMLVFFQRRDTAVRNGGWLRARSS